MKNVVFSQKVLETQITKEIKQNLVKPTYAHLPMETLGRNFWLTWKHKTEFNKDFIIATFEKMFEIVKTDLLKKLQITKL